jgi:hypothetical protein
LPGGSQSSDAGLLLLRQAERKLGHQHQDNVNPSGYLVAVLDAVEQAEHTSNSFAAALAKMHSPRCWRLVR